MNFLRRVVAEHEYPASFDYKQLPPEDQRKLDEELNKLGTEVEKKVGDIVKKLKLDEYDEAYQGVIEQLMDWFTTAQDAAAEQLQNPG